MSKTKEGGKGHEEKYLVKKYLVEICIRSWLFFSFDFCQLESCWNQLLTFH